MPIIQSAIKRVRQEDRRRKRNLIVSRKYKELIKTFEALIEAGKKKEAQAMFSEMQKSIDMAAKKNLIHKNNASRKKSVLAKKLSTTKK